MTNQAKIHNTSESEKLRLEAARVSSRNTIKIRPSCFAVTTDKSNRPVVVQLDLEALLRLRDEIAVAISHAAHDDVLPETLRAIELEGV